VTVEICVLRGRSFSNQFEIVLETKRHPLAAMQLAVSCCELYFSRCCAVNRTGTFALESKVTRLSDFRRNILMFRIPNINQWVKNFL